MQLKKLLFIKLLILLSIAPRFVGAQYSFQWVLKTAGNEEFPNVIETSDGKFILTGNSSGTDSIPGGNYMACFNQQGTMLWQKYYFKSYGTAIYDIKEASNGYFYLGGTSGVYTVDGNPYYIKMNSNGGILFDSSYVGMNAGYGTIDKSFDLPDQQMLIGFGWGSPNYTLKSSHTFQKTSYSGERISIKYIENTLGLSVRNIFKNPDQSGYIMFCDSVYDPMPAYMVRIDTNGNTISKKYIGSNHINNTIVQNTNNTYTLLRDVSWQYYLVTYSAEGDSISSKQLSSAAWLMKDKNDGYILFTDSIEFLDSSMNVVSKQPFWKWKYPDSIWSTAMIARASDGGFYGCGQYISSNPTSIDKNDFYIFKTAPNSTLTDTITYMDIPITGIKEEIKASSDKVKIYPNPATDRIRIEGISNDVRVMINNVLGKIVYLGVNTGSIDVSSFAKGIYFISFTDDQNNHVVRKIIIR